jgi:hypothetical protein
MKKNIKKILRYLESFKIIKYLHSLYTVIFGFTLYLKTFKVVKYFNTYVESKILALQNRINIFFKKKSKVSNFNKILIMLISILFVSLFYLSIPTLYNKTWVQNTLEKKLLEDFNMNFSISSDITYNILPKPHFLIKNSKIFIDNDEEPKQLSEIKNLKVFINQNNFFYKNKMSIKNLIIDKANFSFQGEDLKFLNKISYKKYSNKKIIIRKSNIFFKDKTNETIAIMKVPDASIFYDNEIESNIFKLNGEVFKIPFDMSISQDLSSFKNREINIKTKKLKLNFHDKSIKKSKNLFEGKNIISIFSSKIITEYNLSKNLIIFKSSSSKIKNTNMSYKGKLSPEPFDLKLDFNMDKYNLSSLFNSDSILTEFIKTRLLFNENISVNISMNVNSFVNNEVFKSAILYFNIVNGNINFNKTRLINKKIGILELGSSNLFFRDSKLILNTDLTIYVEDHNKLFSFFQTPKNARKAVEKIFINLDYDLLTNQIDINDLKIDENESNDKMLDVIELISESNNYNLNKSKRIFNKLFSAYSG